MSWRSGLCSRPPRSPRPRSSATPSTSCARPARRRLSSNRSGATTCPLSLEGAATTATSTSAGSASGTTTAPRRPGPHRPSPSASGGRATGCSRGSIRRRLPPRVTTGLQASGCATCCKAAAPPPRSPPPRRAAPRRGGAGHWWASRSTSQGTTPRRTPRIGPPCGTCRATNGVAGPTYRCCSTASWPGAFEERLWWLAQPLYSLPGNDRRTEHLARATMARIEQDARSPFAMFWGDDMRETLLRYGWPAYWTQQPPRSIGSVEPLVTSHEPEPAFHFLADARAFDDPASSQGENWTPVAHRPRERYAPAYATAFAPLVHQVALFRRGDSCLVVAAYDVSEDTLFAGTARDVALVLARDERSVPVIERRPDAGASDVIVAKVDGGPQLLSLELVAAARRHVARARYGVRPHDALAGFSVSDVLLFDPPDTLPTELAAVLPYVRGSTVVRGSARVGLFWEVAGLDSAEATTTVVTVLPVGTGWLRRAAQSLHISGRRATATGASASLTTSLIAAVSASCPRAPSSSASTTGTARTAPSRSRCCASTASVLRSFLWRPTWGRPTPGIETRSKSRCSTPLTSGRCRRRGGSSSARIRRRTPA